MEFSNKYTKKQRKQVPPPHFFYIYLKFDTSGQLSMTTEVTSV